MTWLKDNWRWAALNAVALVVMLSLLRHINTIGDSDADVELMESGKWAIRFLLFSLAMTPLNTLFGWRSATKLRKPAGLWAFGFGLVHLVFYLADVKVEWLRFPIPDYIAALGVVGLAILTAMAATSTRWAMKRMGKGWKRLHRLVYAAGCIALVHGLLESSHKRVALFDSQAALEVQLYLGILVVLLAVRIPAIRTRLVNLRYRLAAGSQRGSTLPTG
jgi:methionine sulfoxide reductase heme-binding subunit